MNPAYIFVLIIALVIGVLVFVLVANAFKEQLSIDRLKRKNIEQRKKLKERSGFAKRLEMLGYISPLSEADAEQYNDMLAQANVQLSAATWRGIQVACTAIGVLLGVACGLMVDGVATLLLVVLFTALGLLGPRLYLMNAANDRRKKIDMELANALEMLSVAVKSGYPLERGIKLIGDTQTGELSREFSIVSTDYNVLGIDMERALRRMQGRCGSQAVTSFTTAIIQCTKQGTSVSRVLDSQARLARNEHFSAQKAQIAKLPSKLVLPMFGIMGVILVIALVPMLYSAMQSVGVVLGQ